MVVAVAVAAVLARGRGRVGAVRIVVTVAREETVAVVMLPAAMVVLRIRQVGAAGGDKTKNVRHSGYKQ